MVVANDVIENSKLINDGDVFYINRYSYTKPISIATQSVPYESVRVDVSETGNVTEGTTVVTYYYKPCNTGH